MKRSADSAFVVEQLPSPESYPSSPTPSSSSSECPPRKRSRSEVTPEERREARAHRNRIAAQNSRDRRKAQFTYLERRVAELEEENRRLRVGKGSKAAQPSEAQKSEEREKDRAREKENEELRERIKTLENGWDAVVKALAASGLPLNVPTPPSTITSESSTASSRPLSTIPLIVPPTPISPTPSSISMSSSMFDFDDFESTRHLARVATTDAPLLSSVSLQRVDSLRINSNWSSSLPNQLRLQHQPATRRRTLLPLTRALWKTSFAKSSRRLPPSRRRSP
ncbi:hypothetical protein EW026_g585 [Hermanssonia centrifuga]|uniref:X-box-binding protein 1 n=1 Tax=Hermanssonia centrifuga TaxID=98765 RepID=A0A4S4KW41_9APHY|nr:hypothetical protein EW026_g585 [Hermanssonia centrifuga]